MHLTELRQNLEAQIREGQLPEALQSLLTQLPDGSETYRIVSALIARLNAANKERYRNTLSFEEYQRRVDQVSADFFDLLAGLTEADFEPASNKTTTGKAGKKGSVLYQIPQEMRLQTPTKCTIRVAVSEEEILDNLVLDKFLKVRSEVDISDVMSAELVDPEGGIFKISSLNARTQLVRDSGYTEWNFNVTPLIEGVHQLLVKVSIMEIVPGFAEPIPREVSMMETVTIITAASPTKASGEIPHAAFKPSGQTFGFQSTPTTPGNFEVQYSKAFEAPSAPSPASLPSNASGNRSLKALALFLAFLVLVPAATWAFAPEIPAWVNARYIQGTPDAYTAFIREYPNSTRLEKAYFYRAETSDRLADLRDYQEKYQQSGRYQAKIQDRISALENRSLEDLRARPEQSNIRQFVIDFPESERLTEVKQAVEARAENRQELLQEVEAAYVSSVKARPSQQKVETYLRDFPKQDRLNEIEAAVRAKPEVFQKVQPLLEDAYLKKMEANPTELQSDQFIQKFPEPIQREKFEQILEKKPGLKKAAREKMRRLEAARNM
jgi:hypothetical protein